ncbi:hypothetical protein [Rhodopseudomonas palustris]|uniref:hypothetical protein n=1 Tax=Rhodopseudomonas palustris TaxID=1076 RepID=UPI0015FF24D9|nr:hypothetical protein [Rhodopseudomonas palustris]
MVIANALSDAFAHPNVAFNATPIKPEQIAQAVMKQRRIPMPRSSRPTLLTATASPR